MEFFSADLRHGNSLVGCDRCVHTANNLIYKDKSSRWDQVDPTRLQDNEERTSTEYYNFFLPDEGMCTYPKKDIPFDFKEELKAIEAWKKEVLKPLNEIELDQLLELSDMFDQSETQGKKIVCDYWCGLWYIPLDEVELLPSRQEMFDDYKSIMQRHLNNRIDAITCFARDANAFHWFLEFEEVFKKNGGFDLTIGNPPWLKLEWDEKAFFEKFYTEMAIMSATDAKKFIRRKINDA